MQTDLKNTMIAVDYPYFAPLLIKEKLPMQQMCIKEN